MFNEEAGLEPLFTRLIPILQRMETEWPQHSPSAHPHKTFTWEIVCVDDGSRDGTWPALQAWHAREPRIKALHLSRNFGKELALTCALDHARGDALIPLDADLQDPPELIPELLAQWRAGFHVVLATRRSRPGDSWLKAASARWFYRIINRMSTIAIPENTGDFRLIDRRVADALRRMPERIRFMKGLFAWVGFRTTTVYYDRPARHSGTTSWNPWKLWQFALDGIFSFTTLPLRVWSYVGAVVSLGALGWALFLVARTVLHGVDVPGYASLMVAVLFFGGVQLLSLGILGEYVGRIYREAKHRPLYLIQDSCGLAETAAKGED